MERGFRSQTFTASGFSALFRLGIQVYSRVLEYSSEPNPKHGSVDQGQTGRNHIHIGRSKISFTGLGRLQRNFLIKTTRHRPSLVFVHKFAHRNDHSKSHST